jgi:hypothetical protein
MSAGNGVFRRTKVARIARRRMSPSSIAETDVDLDRAARTIDQAEQGNAYAGVVGLLANLCGLDSVR